MPPVRIPAAAANGLTLPVCVRHGRAGRTMKPMVFASRPPAWALLLLLFGGGVLYLIVAHYLRKEVFVRAWPWCGRCGLTRLWRALLGLVILAAGAKLALTSSDTVKGVGALVVIVVTVTLMIAGWVMFTRSTRDASAGVGVSRDGQWLVLTRPHERFLAALREQPAPVYPMPAGWTVPATAAPSAVWAAAPAAAVADRTPPVASPVPGPSDGWTPPSA
ncbi:hypothetical protein OHA72_61050 [Dactylosporangium sp. NBC_01737]|uniref:hypothetical protein n=1 Tax=Dactylosporangium sp. NBC_01737 TaxID=2975959 RepID=UPI002E127DA0|nr:hypothetical protein OHA72_61050 [Dactylosporangium sp. NBC_01737]